jgi:lipid-A-disaccharide synthase
VSRIFVIAGESSGDALGGAIMRALREHDPDIAFDGVGGPDMTAAGLTSRFPMTELAVMGLTEVLPKLPGLLRRIRETADAVVAARPDAVLTIDAPDFCFRVAKRVKARAPDIPVIHMVAPTVWAWRPGRAAKVARFLDHMLCLLPFEPPYFEREGLAATFVGHPIVQQPAPPDLPEAFRVRHGIPADAPLLAVLPGSRTGEVARHLPVFGETVARLAQAHPGLHAVTATVGHVAETVRDAASSWAAPVTVIDAQANDGGDKRAAFAAATAALAASGTVSVELAAAGCAGVVAYRVHPLTAAIARRLIRVEHASLINLIAGRAVVPEFIQQDCTADNLTAAVSALLGDADARAEQRAAFDTALAAMGRGGPAPAERAAAVVGRYL